MRYAPRVAGAGAAGKRRGAAVLSLLGLAALGLWLAVGIAPTAEVRLYDFEGYWSAARVVLSGDTQDLYAPERKWFTNLPVLAWLLAPLGRLDYALAWRVFWGVQVACFALSFAVSLLLLARHFPPLTAGRALVVGAVLVCFAPVLERCLAQGQSTPLVALLLALFHLLHREGWRRTAGTLLGIACLVKIPPLVLVAGLALRRRLEAALTATLVVLAGVAVSALAFGPELLGQYADRVILDNLGRAQAAFNNQSLEGAFMRVFTAKSLVDWDTTARPLAVTAALLASLLGLGAWLWLRGGRALVWPGATPRDDDPVRGSFELELALGSALMLLFLPVAWIHYYLLLAVPLAVLPAWWVARRVPVTWGAALLLAAGLWLASGSEVRGNHYYGLYHDEPSFRLRQNAQPLGAVLIVLGLSVPLAEIARREQNPKRAHGQQR